MGMRFKRGSVEGTGSAINVELGFTPDFIMLFNIDDAGGLEPAAFWINGMGDGDFGLLLGTPTWNLETSNGITTYDGSEGSASKGFTIGANANMNATGETILYVAFGAE